jgi:shikimate kinase
LISSQAELTAGPQRIIALAGPVCAGKTTLAHALAEHLGASVLAARKIIMEELDADDRAALQEAGRTLERRTQGRWLAEAAIRMDAEQLVVDAARTPAQAQGLLNVGPSTKLIYLAASEDTCRRRFFERNDPVDTGIDFDEMLAGELPLLPELRQLADLAIETDELAAQEVAAGARHFLTQ